MNTVESDVFCVFFIPTLAGKRNNYVTKFIRKVSYFRYKILLALIYPLDIIKLNCMKYVYTIPVRYTFLHY